MRHLLFWCVAATIAFCSAGCSSGPAASGGGGTETVLGVLYTDSAVAAGVRVSIMSIADSPCDSADGRILFDTTDSEGRFSFVLSDSGTYALSAVYNGYGFMHTVVVGDSLPPVVDTMQPVGAVDVTLPTNADRANGYLYVKGMPRLYPLAAYDVLSSSVVLDSLPSGTQLRIVYGVGAGVDRSVTSITVVPFDTVFAAIDSTASKPIWYFPVYALVSPATLAVCGGSLDSAAKLIALQLDSVNARFNASDLFNGTFQFAVEKVDSLKTSLDNAMIVDPPIGYALKLVYHASSSTDVPGEIETYYRSLLVNYNGGDVFSPVALNPLVHYLSRLRGALPLDIFALAENSLCDIVYAPPVSILSKPDSALSWDAYSAGIINAYGDSWNTGYSDYEYCNQTMVALRVGVVNSSGDPVANASLTVYGQDWLSSAVNTMPARVAMTTGTDGTVLFDPSPFDVKASGSPVRSGLLVRAISPDNTDTAWAFLSFVDAAGLVFNGASEVTLTAEFLHYAGN